MFRCFARRAKDRDTIRNLSFGPSAAHSHGEYAPSSDEVMEGGEAALLHAEARNHVDVLLEAFKVIVLCNFVVEFDKVPNLLAQVGKCRC